jgi:hypothetical protein
MATASHSKVECTVNWQPPATSEEQRETAKLMAEAQLEVVRRHTEGADATVADAALLELVRTRQLPLYKRRVDALETDGGREWRLTLPLVVRDLLPKFAQVYRATADGLVRNEPRCSEFNSLEADVFGALNREPKP